MYQPALSPGATRRLGASPSGFKSDGPLRFSWSEQATGCPGSTPPQKQQCRVDTAHQIQHTWLERLAFGPTPIHDHLIQLWLGIFPVNWRQLPDPALLVGQIEAIRGAMSGTYADLLRAMLANPALQISLDGLRSHRARPNENLARELLELFSLGEGQFSEADVIEAARALTGYRLNPDGSLSIDPRRHDDRPKTILGRTFRFNGPTLVTWLCQQQATASHITARLWRHLVGPLPDQARLITIASAWRRQELSLPWLIQALLGTPEATASLAEGGMLRDPIDLVIASLALIGSRHPDAIAAARLHLVRMGQVPFEPPSVKGWPVNQEWLHLRGLQARRRGLQVLLADEEVWASRSAPDRLQPALTPIPPLTLGLPAEASRQNLALLFADPVWQLK